MDVSDQNEDITYKQLNFETANLANCFKEFNINTGDSIAIILPNSVDDFDKGIPAVTLFSLK